MLQNFEIVLTMDEESKMETFVHNVTAQFSNGTNLKKNFVYFPKIINNIASFVL